MAFRLRQTNTWKANSTDFSQLQISNYKEEWVSIYINLIIITIKSDRSILEITKLQLPYQKNFNDIGVPQGSVLEPMLFLIDYCDIILCWEKEENAIKVNCLNVVNVLI